MRRYPVAAYFVLAFVIAWGGVAIVVKYLPVSLVTLFVPMAAGPTLASLIMTGLVSGKAGYRDLFSRLTRWRVAPRWYAVALLLAPLMILLVLGLLSLTSRAFLPGIFVTEDRLALMGFALAGGLAAGLFEEIGWTGFATPRLLARQGWVAAGLALGLVWATWHIGPDLPGSKEWGARLPWRILLWMYAGMVPYRMLMTWVYRHTGSFLVAVLMHVGYTGGQILLEPFRAQQLENLMWWGLLGGAMWLAVGIVVMASRGR